MTEKTEREIAAHAGEQVHKLLIKLQDETGIPTSCLLAGAHAQIVALMALAMGGPTAAARCEAAANKVRNTPSMRAYSLAIAPPAGRA